MSKIASPDFRLAIFATSRPAAMERRKEFIVEIRKNFMHEQSEGFTCMTPSRTDQTQKDECDVNVIIRNYVNTGVLLHTNPNPPQFGDFSEMPSDYGEAVALIERSKEEFMKLPSDVRDRFDNKPGNMINFLKDEKNRDEAIKLGLINKPEMKE